MDQDRFWSIVDDVKDSPKPNVAIAVELRKLLPEEIISFQENMNRMRDQANRWDLWGAAYLMQGGCSDDAFEYFRLGLISKGKEIYENVLRNPDLLADLELLNKHEELNGELFGYAVMQIYEELTGSKMPLPSGTNILEPEGEEWDFDDLDECEKRLPKLTAKAAKLYSLHESASQHSCLKELSSPQNKPWWKFW